MLLMRVPRSAMTTIFLSSSVWKLFFAFTDNKGSLRQGS